MTSSWSVCRKQFHAAALQNPLQFTTTLKASYESLALGFLSSAKTPAKPAARRLTPA